jgi:ABC-type spermidine/putrescine transport system permease subunit II
LPLGIVLGTLAAVQLSRSRGRWRSFSVGILALPLFLPPVMFGLAIIIGLNAIDISRGLWTIVAAHTLMILPVVTFLVLVRLEGLDPNVESAAMDLGARPGQVLIRITVPQTLPAIVGSALIGFALSMDEFVLTFLVTGNDVTLPLFVYSALRYNVTPELNALSALMLASSFVLFGAGIVVLRGWSTLSQRRARIPIP